MKRVLIFSDTYLPEIGGAEYYTKNFALSLIKNGYEVTIFTNSLGGGEIIEREIRVIRRAWPGFFKIWEIIRMAKEVAHLIRKNDLIFSNYTYRLTAIVALVSVFLRREFFVLAHGLGTIIDEGYPTVYKVYRYISIKLARGAVATSSELAKIVSRYNKNVIVATAVDFSFIDRNLNVEGVLQIKNKFKNKKIIITVRRLAEKNGIQYLVRAMPYVVAKLENVIYLVIGDGPLAGRLQAMSVALKMNDHIVFLGKLSNEKVFNFIKAADVEVFPSSAEAMSLAAIEGMYIGTPIVATPVGGLKELIGEKEERGYLADLFDIDKSLYSAPVIELISEDKYRLMATKIVEAIGQGSTKVAAARKFVSERFDWSITTNKILEFYFKSNGLR